MERKLAAMDFSRFSKVKASLLQKIKEQQTENNAELSMEEMDMVAAARNIERSDNRWKK